MGASGVGGAGPARIRTILGSNGLDGILHRAAREHEPCERRAQGPGTQGHKIPQPKRDCNDFYGQPSAPKARLRHAARQRPTISQGSPKFLRQPLALPPIWRRKSPCEQIALPRLQPTSHWPRPGAL